jgi:5-methylcytosine-specific restriction endonuclease McrA
MPMGGGVCAQCGAFVRSRRSSWLCKRCRKTATKAARYSKRYALTTCASCHREYRPTRSPQSYCSLACRPSRPRHDRTVSRFTARLTHTASQLHPSSTGPYLRVCAWCGAGYLRAAPRSSSPVHRTYCSRACGKAASRNSPARRDAQSRAKHRRRERTRHQDGAPLVYRSRIYERDGWRCQLCHKSVVRTAKVPHPKAPTLDHIIPLSAGGRHEPTNVQLAHFGCNHARGATGPAQLRWAD